MASSGTRRGSIVEAMVRVAGREGYRALSVADVIAEADVSRTTFYKHFGDKHECFLAAYGLATARVRKAVERGCAGQDSWLEQARGGLVALVDLFAADPKLARTVVVEAAAGGAETRRRQLELIGLLAQRLEQGRDVGAPGLPAGTPLMAVSAVNGLLFEEIKSGRAAELPVLLPEFLFALLVPFLGPAEAVEAMR
ncbi:MAG: TetR/AcrR family transcriptional regulator [Solirubrobacterales bacterium]